MALSVDGLRKHYPIIDPEHYTACRVKFWLAEAQIDLRQNVWGARWERGVYAYVAHKLIVEKASLDLNEDGFGGIKANRGTVTGESESVGGVNYSTSYSSTASAGDLSSRVDAPWETTLPGRDYLEMAEKVGAARGIAYVE